MEILFLASAVKALSRCSISVPECTCLTCRALPLQALIGKLFVSTTRTVRCDLCWSTVDYCMTALVCKAVRTPLPLATAWRNHHKPGQRRISHLIDSKHYRRSSVSHLYIFFPGRMYFVFVINHQSRWGQQNMVGCDHHHPYHILSSCCYGYKAQPVLCKPHLIEENRL